MKEDSTYDSATKKAAPRQAGFFEDHHALRTVLERVKSTRDLNLMIPLLDELHRLLEEHFAREEESDGLFQVVNEAAPQHLPRVQELLDQHGTFLKTVRSIRKKTKYLVEGALAEVFENVEGLCSDLETHEAAENEILTDALYRDLGESG